MRRVLAILLILLLSSFTNISLTNSAITTKSQITSVSETIKRTLKQSIGQKYLASKYNIITDNIPDCLPVDTLGYNKITDVYGTRAKHPVTGVRSFHYGIDFSGKRGTKVYPSAYGVVREVKYSSSYGNYIVIDHLNGLTTLYAHLKKTLVKVDDVVVLNSPIGLLGSTGRSTGPHLHFEIHVNGNPVNPKVLLTDRKTINFKDLSNIFQSNKTNYDHGKNGRIFSRELNFQGSSSLSRDFAIARPFGEINGNNR